MQIDLFEHDNTNGLSQLGHSKITYKPVGTILNKTSGFMADYDYSLNPYSGCSFGCTYCYAAFFVRDINLKDDWGYWVQVKENALELLKKIRKKPITGKTVYMSSVTDPYQPIERKISLTRSILKELLEYHQPRLVIQTRSPIVTRDIDLLQKFKHVQVNMTVTTDSEVVRKVFEPFCPDNKTRLSAIAQLKNAGISSCITMTPLLPLDNPELFAKQLLETGVSKFIIQPFHEEKGKFIAGTRKQAMELFEKYHWTRSRYLEVEKIIQSYIPNIGVGKEGFAPI